MQPKNKRICIGAFAGAHGVKGDAKVKSFTAEPLHVAAYGPVESEDKKRSFTLSVIRALKPDLLLVRAPEIKDREDAESLKGKRIYIERNKLPPVSDDEFYLDDLVGLQAFDEQGEPLGVISAVHNFGAGDLIELKDTSGDNAPQLIPFTKEAAPHVDIEGGKIIIIRAALQEQKQQHNSQSDKSYIHAAMREEDS